MPLVVRIAIAGLISFTGIISKGVVSELYGTWQKFWTTGALEPRRLFFGCSVERNKSRGPVKPYCVVVT